VPSETPAETLREDGEARPTLARAGAETLPDSQLGPRRRLSPLSGAGRRFKINFSLKRLPKDGLILDFGCAENWFKQAAAERGFHNVVGLDLGPPADVIGDIRQWRALDLEPHSFDAIVAFEVVEHGDYAEALHDLLKPDGQLLVTTPVPRMDPICRLLEACRLLQQRSSPHTHLIDLRRFPRFEVIERQVKAGLSQWGVLRPIPSSDPPAGTA